MLFEEFLHSYTLFCRMTIDSFDVALYLFKAMLCLSASRFV